MTPDWSSSPPAESTDALGNLQAPSSLTTARTERSICVRLDLGGGVPDRGPFCCQGRGGLLLRWKVSAGAHRHQARSCPCPRRGPGRGCSLTPVPLRLVRRLSGAGGGVSSRWWLDVVLELAV